MRKETESATADTQVKEWDFKHLSSALVIAFCIQSMFLPCLCSIGTAKIVFAYSIDGLVMLRMLGAFVLKEHNTDWKIYAGLIWTSPLWIETVARVFLGPH